MSYNNQLCQYKTSQEIQDLIQKYVGWLDKAHESKRQAVEKKVSTEALVACDIRIKELQQSLHDLRADLIVKKQEEKQKEAKAEMKQLLSRLLQLVDST